MCWIVFTTTLLHASQFSGISLLFGVLIYIWHYVVCVLCYNLSNIFRELHEIAKHYVLRILFVEQAVPQAVVSSWVSQAYSK